MTPNEKKLFAKQRRPSIVGTSTDNASERLASRPAPVPNLDSLEALRTAFRRLGGFPLTKRPKTDRFGPKWLKHSLTIRNT